MGIGMSGEELPQVLARVTVGHISSQQPLEGVRNLTRWAAVAHWPCRCLVESDCATQAEVVSIHQAAFVLDLLALNAYVRDPVLAAAVWASGDMQLQVLIETGQAFIEFFHQPASETLCFGDGELAKFGAAAGDRAAPEW